MKNNKALSMLGLAAKAGKVISGEFGTEKAIKEGKAYLVLVAEDASDNTKKLFTNKCNYYQVPLKFFKTKQELGKAIGKEARASIAVLDSGFGNEISKNIDMQENMEV